MAISRGSWASNPEGLLGGGGWGLVKCIELNRVRIYFVEMPVPSRS